jgi:hypothetical protein
LDKLHAAQTSEKGLVIRRALDLIGALKLGVRIPLQEIRADELQTMIIIAEEQGAVELQEQHGHGSSIRCLTT